MARSKPNKSTTPFKRKAAGKKPPSPSPDIDATVPARSALLAFLEKQAGPLTRNEIARAFALKGPARAELREALYALVEDGLLVRGSSRRYLVPGRLPPVTVIEVTGVDEDGEAVAVPIQWCAS